MPSILKGEEGTPHGARQRQRHGNENLEGRDLDNAGRTNVRVMVGWYPVLAASYRAAAFSREAEGGDSRGLSLSPIDRRAWAESLALKFKHQSLGQDLVIVPVLCGVAIGYRSPAMGAIPVQAVTRRQAGSCRVVLFHQRTIVRPGGSRGAILHDYACFQHPCEWHALQTDDTRQPEKSN